MRSEIHHLMARGAVLVDTLLDLDQHLHPPGLPIPLYHFGAPPGDRILYHGEMGRFFRHAFDLMGKSGARKITPMFTAY
jgi:hypothetical protein